MNEITHAKETIYDRLKGKHVRIVCSGYSFIGCLKECSLESLVLNPSLVSYSTSIGDDARVEHTDTIVDYRGVLGVLEIDEGFMARYCNDARISRKIKEKELEKALGGQLDNNKQLPLSL